MTINIYICHHIEYVYYIKITIGWLLDDCGIASDLPAQGTASRPPLRSGGVARRCHIRQDRHWMAVDQHTYTCRFII